MNHRGNKISNANQILWKNGIRPILKKLVISVYDRRYIFRDLSKLRERKPHSPIIQFYSSAPNIGNYTAVLGITDYLNLQTDKWCMHDTKIDFDFINKNYRMAIIGGAGLIQKIFEPFWKKFLKESKLPTIIWGVGACLDKSHSTAMDKKLVKEALAKCELVNLRDYLTVERYGINNAHVSCCPTIYYLKRFNIRKNSDKITYSHHDELIDKYQYDHIRKLLKQHKKYLITDNIQRWNQGLVDIINKCYAETNMVITSRLHGAIIAYGLKKPYFCISGDYKIEAFCDTYGNGMVLSDIDDIKHVDSLKENVTINEIDYKALESFGSKAKIVIDTLCVSK